MPSGIFSDLAFPYPNRSTLSALFGYLFVMLTACCESVFNIMGRKVNKRGDASKDIAPPVQAGIVSLTAFVMCLLPMAAERPFHLLKSLQADVWLALLWYGSVVTVAAFTLFYYGARYCDGYTIAALSGITPVSALAMSIVVVKERPVFSQLIGCGLIVSAIMMTGSSGQNKTVSEAVSEPPG